MASCFTDIIFNSRAIQCQQPPSESAVLDSNYASQYWVRERSLLSIHGLLNAHSMPMIGSYLNMMLYTLELVEAYIYYFTSPRSSKDHIFLKCCVATSLVSDTVGTIGICALTFIVSAPNAIIFYLILTCLKTNLVFTGMLLISID